MKILKAIVQYFAQIKASINQRKTDEYFLNEFDYYDVLDKD